jgi:hypothetical protein
MSRAIWFRAQARRKRVPSPDSDKWGNILFSTAYRLCGSEFHGVQIASERLSASHQMSSERELFHSDKLVEASFRAYTTTYLFIVKWLMKHRYSFHIRPYETVQITWN